MFMNVKAGQNTCVNGRSSARTRREARAVAAEIHAVDRVLVSPQRINQLAGVSVIQQDPVADRRNHTRPIGGHSNVVDGRLGPLALGNAVLPYNFQIHEAGLLVERREPLFLSTSPRAAIPGERAHPPRMVACRPRTAHGTDVEARRHQEQRRTICVRSRGRSQEGSFLLFEF